MRKTALLGWLALSSMTLFGQSTYWQQRVQYQMDVDMDVASNRYTGKTKLTYTNHSPDTLRQVFFHLYPNAFQPNSEMDVRSRSLADPDSRVGSRIADLKPDEIGYLHVAQMKQDGKKTEPKEWETILQVPLDHPLLPGGSTVFEFDFDGQVPVQIRRSGRDNREGIRYSMSQWYPKLCEYDPLGWHANPYIGREFHGVWGDFEVNMSLDGSYCVAATGVLQNPQDVGHGYEKAGSDIKRKPGKITWKWKAANVHDFVWAADPDYKHVIRKVEGGPEVHFFYQPGNETQAWDELPAYTEKAFREMNKRFGVYPYSHFYVVQGGDGGMEYPMATLITGNRGLESLVGVTVHEMIHSWYHGVLATNESLYPWMDEGFTSYAESEVMAMIMDRDLGDDPHMDSYNSYFRLVKDGLQEPLTTHADHYKTNRAYGTNAYSKGEVTLHQLGYVIGRDVMERGLLRYFKEWGFKHPSLNDFRRCMERHSGLELDWYFEYWVNTLEVIDYGVQQVVEQDGKTYVQLRRIGNMPMPIDLVATFSDGHQEFFYIPLREMYGKKTETPTAMKRSDAEPWPWTHGTYVLEIPAALSTITELEIDPSGRMADVDKKNNTWTYKMLKRGPSR